ncbi:MAG TPA: tRNA pseudouridine(55) synthase TruB [Burkholderiaceae bacterium]|nr:tRNA pseudouridine(55) synthase TruB [Burkholderiaceae bacterium]
MARKRKGEAISGVLLLDKPAGRSSNHALQTIRRLMQAAKAGHGGTLDPMATGLLPLLFGEATKFSADLLEADKSYRAWVTLGVRTSTADADGEVIERRAVVVSADDVRQVVAGFVGEMDQVPPMVSAIKRDGQPLYVYARKGIELEREPRRVRIARIEVCAVGADRFCMDVDCSKGTYIRTLAEDIGQRLGCGAHLSGLARTRVGPWTLEQAIGIERLESMDLAARRAQLMAVDSLLAGLPKVMLGIGQARLFAHGGALDLGGEAGLKRVYGPDGTLIGTARMDADGMLHPRRLVAQGQDAQMADSMDLIGLGKT